MFLKCGLIVFTLLVIDIESGKFGSLIFVGIIPLLLPDEIRKARAFIGANSIGGARFETGHAITYYILRIGGFVAMDEIESNCIAPQQIDACAVFNC